MLRDRRSPGNSFVQASGPPRHPEAADLAHRDVERHHGAANGHHSQTRGVASCCPRTAHAGISVAPPARSAGGPACSPWAWSRHSRPGARPAPTAGVGGRSAAAPPGARTDLRGICPDPIVVQTSWFSQVEHFVAYQLLGSGYTVDAGHKRVTGPLVAHGVDTGVRIEIRAGGPAIGFEQVSAQMYADRSITLGMIPLDEAIQNSAGQPVTGVDDPVRRRPAGDHVGPGDVPGVQHDLRHRPDRHQGAVLQRRAHLHGLPARHRPAATVASGRIVRRLAGPAGRVPRRDRRAGPSPPPAVEVGARGAGLGQAAALPAGGRLRLSQLPQPARDPVR